MEVQKGEKDCRTCNRRRIKCDRSLPNCRKCESRNLKCPGYAMILQWDHGVASRGKLRGLRIPVLPQPTDDVRPLHHSLVEPKVNHYNDQRNEIQTLTLSKSLAVTNQPLKISFALSPLATPQLEDPKSRQLLYHYDQVITSNMTWADSPNSPWRHIIIPMALQSPPLLSAVLAFSAKHISAMSTSASAIDFSGENALYVKKHQQRALKLLSREVSEIAAAKHPDVGGGRAQGDFQRRINAALATMLVLCNVETVWPDSMVWRIHLDAARTVLTSRTSAGAVDPEDDTAMFLGQELFIANTFASITDFDESSTETIEASTNNGVLVDFIKLIQLVTRIERQTFKNPTLASASNISPSGLRALWEHARSLTMTSGIPNKDSSPTDRLQFSRIVNSFYHAGVVYSYRALFSTGNTPWEREIASQIALSRTELFAALAFMEPDKPTLAQDLVWPLFVAGTEATTAEERELVVRKLADSMRGTGFSNCQHALKFLRALWTARDELGDDVDTEGKLAELNWIGFAREWAKQGNVFLVF